MDFEVSILTSPNKKLTVDKELNLLKIALLYSDKINIVSPAITMYLSIIKMSSLGIFEKFNMIQQWGEIIDPAFNNDNFSIMLKQAQILKDKKYKNKQEILALRKYKSFIKEINKSFEDLSNRMFYDTKFDELMPLIDKGIINFKHIDEFDQDKMIQFILDEIEEVIKNDNQYPLFDETIGSLAESYTKKENITYNKENIKEINFSKEIVFKIPNIDALNFEQIINMKEELKNESSKFKNAILVYSKSIDALPFSAKYKQEINKKYSYYIKPEIELLQEKINSNTYIKNLFKELVSNSSKYTKNVAVILAACNFFEIEKLLSIAGLLPELTYKVLSNKKKKDKEYKSHPLFFYYKLYDSK
ncbi:MAG: hypothetical protein ACOCRK_06875 [bacterium]